MSEVAELKRRIAQLEEDTRFLKTTNIDLKGRRFVNGGKPVSPFDFVTKTELDQRLSGVSTVINTVNAVTERRIQGALVQGQSIRFGTFSTRGTAIAHENEVFFATDQDYAAWASDGADWQPVRSTEIEDAATNSVSDGTVLRHSTSGTAAAGFGTRQEVKLDNDNGDMEDASSFDTVWSDATDGSEDSDIIISLRAGGAALAAVMRILGTGHIRIVKSGGLLQLEGATSSESAVKRVGTAVAARLADDSAYTALITSLLQLGGTSSSEPALKANSAKLQARLADDSATTDLEVADEAYDATNWNGSVEVPTKNAVRDKIEAMIDDTAYGAGWNGSTAVAPSRNAVYDQINPLFGVATYTPSNVVTTRTYDADATSTEELADVLGSLIGDLQTAGILS